MKSFLRAAAATGVAAATLAAGLSFGPAASASTSAESVRPSATRSSTGLVGPMVFNYGNDARTPYAVDQTLRIRWTANVGSAADFAFPSVGDQGLVRLVGSDKCLSLGAKDSFVNLATCDSADPAQVWMLTTSRTLKNVKFSDPIGVASTDTALNTKNNPDTLVVGNLRPAVGASVSEVDLEAGTAKLVDGVAPEGTETVEVSWQTADGATKQRYVSLKDDGTWSRDLDGLALGKTTVHLTARTGDEVLAESDVEVDLAVSDLTADDEFSDDVDEVAHITGTATPKTSIVAFHGEQEIQSTRTDAEGKYSLAIDPPNIGGPYDVQVEQRIRGQVVDSAEVHLDYGPAVSITGPEDGEFLDPGDDLVVRGTSQPGAKLKIYEQGKSDAPLKELTVGPSGTYFAAIDGDDLEDRQYDLVVAGISKGHNLTSAEVTINPGKSTVKQPTAHVDFDTDVTKKAVVSGEGADDATITVKNGMKILGSASVIDGKWSLPIDPIGPGAHTLDVEQTGVDGTQTTTAVADYGNAVEFTTADGVSFTGGALTVSGRSVRGAKVVINTGGKQVDSFTVDTTDGSFTRDLTGLGSGNITLNATADSRGGLHTEDTLTASSPTQVEAISVASHVKGGTFVPGTQIFTGHATADATVTMNPFGFDPKYAAYNLTTTADQFGEWSISRGLSDTPYPFISFKQTPQSGVVNELINYDLKPYKEIGQPGDLTLTNFKAGDYFNPGDQVFTGTATPGAEVTLNPFGFDPKYTAYNITTTADETTGQWQIRRGLAAGTVYRDLAVKQDPAAEGKVNLIEHITVAANDWVGASADLQLTAPGTTFTPGTEQTFSGTATPGTTVTLYPFGDDKHADIKMTTKVDATGAWTIKRTLSNQPYPVVITQTDQPGKTNRIAHTMTPIN